ncbi:MAG: UDP-2,3-diacylglucosamine diphosphatase [Saprospiraceae bacterium]|nr:UDP-2,3-diacylglucosamine diphosphatase [Saprospiraceae bacterium]
MGIKEKRKLELVVLSDLHLGTYGCRSEAIYEYLQSIDPETIILNGDIIDIWAFDKNYFPEYHIRVIQKLLKMAAKGSKIFYLLGNHDEAIRRYADFELGNIRVCNKLVLHLNGKKTWIFHGDIFDLSIQHTKFLAKLGGKAYDFLILLNAFINQICDWFGWEKFSLSKKIKGSIKQAVKYIQDFETTAIQHAADQDYDQVICGHLHNPVIRTERIKGKNITYLNSGDWIENCTALEYQNQEWCLYRHPNVYHKKNSSPTQVDFAPSVKIPNTQSLYEDIVFDSRYR